MNLSNAHEGYEYQDLLTAYFILYWILEDISSSFVIDKKEYENDKFDDLTIINSKGVYKKQIKYSNPTSNHTLGKSDLSTDGSYKLAIDELFNSWSSYSGQDLIDLRLCLAWNNPTDELIEILEPSLKAKSFDNHPTKLFKICGQKLWPADQEPISNWRRLKAKSDEINRDEFLKFCDNLVIETNLPKSSIDIYSPDALEKIVLDQVERLGIGSFPNDNIKKEEFVLGLSSLIRKSRSKGFQLTTDEIFNHFQIKTNYGSIEQVFPIDESKNVPLKDNISYILKTLIENKKVILNGEPGSGKSWVINNLVKELNNKKIKSIKHYCYTDIQDKLQKERIQKNIFFGNLINDILKEFPELKEKKYRRYASDLFELNLLIEHIPEPTVLIIDGLDHINRVFNYRPYHDLSLNDIEIINEIKKINCSDNLSIFVASQPITEIDEITDFKRISIPSWAIEDVRALMSKMYLSEISLGDSTLSELLLIKSQGNPLYLTYLIEELKSVSVIDKDAVNELPPYSYNLSEYYKYILSKVELGRDVPLALSAVNFTLTKNELKDITGLGTYVDDSLSALKPVLKQNTSSNGYIIYHESFRRYIIEYLKTKEIVEARIFRPVIDWFEKQDFFTYPKAYRFYLQLIVDGSYFSKALKFISKDFLKNCLYSGHPWEIIENNYKLLAKAGSESKDFANIILLNEINKTLSGIEDEYGEAFMFYIEALGHYIGFEQVSNFLVFEGNPTLPLKQGLEVCYIIDNKNKVAPWNYYWDYFKEGEPIRYEDFHLYSKLLIATSNKEKLIEIGRKIIDRGLFEFGYILADECNNSNNQEFLGELLRESAELNSIINEVDKKSNIEHISLLDMANEIIEYENVFDSEVPQIKSFFIQVREQTSDNKTIDQIIHLFSAKNWFYNWLIYYIKIIRIQSGVNNCSEEVRTAFDYLTYTTEPFKGKPRTCDLYSLSDFINSSICDGVSLIQNTEDWKYVLDILTKTSIDTTTYLQNSPSGPFATHRYFKLCIDFLNSENAEIIAETLENLYLHYEKWQFHSFLAEYCFQLVKVFAFLNRGYEVEKYFKQGVDYVLGYTWRRDLTLEDLTESIESLHQINSTLGNEYILKLKDLVDSVVEHTDGKDTKHFPVEWFEKFYNINPKNASLYLLKELSDVRYDWRLESSFNYLLNQSQGNINPLIESFLHQTLIVESSENHIMTGLNLSESVNNIAESALYGSLRSKLKIRQNSERSHFLQDELRKKQRQLGLTDKFFSNYKVRNSRPTQNIDPIVKLKNECISRKEFSDMSSSELSNYLKDNPITKKDIQSLIYKFDSYTELTPEFKEVIEYLVGKNERYHDEKNIDLIPLFDSETDSSIYFWVARFVYQKDGWFKSLSNIKAFQKAYKLNPEKTFEFLFELIPNKLVLGWNRVFSANLFNALSKTKIPTSELTESWLALYDIIESRLPSTEKYDWQHTLTDNFQMSMQEIFACLLISRFKSYSVQRYHIVISGLTVILFSAPELLIKPIKWFFSQHKQFKKSVIVGVLELLTIYDKENSNYISNFTEELLGLYPTNYFMIDYLIEYSLNLPKRKQLVENTDLHYPVESDEVDYFIQINYRHHILMRAGIDVGNLFGKYKATYFRKYNDELELYGNRMYKRAAASIYYSDYILTLINEDYYNKLKGYGDTENVYNDLKIDIRTLVAQYLSLIPRPNNLFSTKEQNFANLLCDIQTENGWVRLGHYEYELKKYEHYELKENKTYGGIVFSNNSEFPIAGYRLFMNAIWDDITIPYGISDEIVFSSIQTYYQIEDYKILWLNPVIVKLLNLEVCHFREGLKATNTEGETVLKFNSWIHEYIATDYSHGVMDEISLKDGAELLIRADYFDKICELFDAKPNYAVFKTSQA